MITTSFRGLRKTKMKSCYSVCTNSTRVSIIDDSCTPSTLADDMLRKTKMFKNTIIKEMGSKQHRTKYIKTTTSTNQENINCRYILQTLSKSPLHFTITNTIIDSHEYK